MGKKDKRHYIYKEQNGLNVKIYPGVFYREIKVIGSESAVERMYYIRYRVGGRNGKIVEEPVGKSGQGMTAAKANNLRAQRTRDLSLSNKAKRQATEEAKQKQQDMPAIARLWEAYDQARPERSIRKADTSYYQKHLAPVFANKSVEELTVQDLRNFNKLMSNKTWQRGEKKPKAGNLAKKYTPQTIKHVLALLRRIIRHGIKNNLCPQPDPALFYFELPSVDNTKTESLTPEQIKALLQALNEEEDQHSASIMRLALFTGMRKSALLALKWQDIDFERGFITLQGAFAKNKKTESIPMSAAARQVLQNLKGHDGVYVFPGKAGGHRAEFKRMANRIKEKAGLPADFRPIHGLRHAYASLLASSGKVDIYTLQKLLTHKDPKMTQRYAHLADEALQRAARVADGIFDSLNISDDDHE